MLKSVDHGLPKVHLPGKMPSGAATPASVPVHVHIWQLFSWYRQPKPLCCTLDPEKSFLLSPFLIWPAKPLTCLWACLMPSVQPQMPPLHSAPAELQWVVLLSVPFHTQLPQARSSALCPQPLQLLLAATALLQQHQHRQHRQDLPVVREVSLPSAPKIQMWFGLSHSLLGCTSRDCHLQSALLGFPHLQVFGFPKCLWREVVLRTEDFLAVCNSEKILECGIQFVSFTFENCSNFSLPSLAPAGTMFLLWYEQPIWDNSRRLVRRVINTLKWLAAGV